MSCVTLHALRAQRQLKRLGREPVVRRTGRFVERHVVRTSIATFVPAVVSDTFIHHKAISIDTLLNVATDDVSVSTLTALAFLITRFI